MTYNVFSGTLNLAQFIQFKFDLYLRLGYFAR